MKQTFSTARALATGIEWVGWAIVTLAVAGTAIVLNTGTAPTGASTLIVVATGAAVAATGLGLVLAAQIVQAQVATAINTGEILEHVAKLTPTQTTHTRMQPLISSQKPTPSKHPSEPYGARSGGEGRFLRMVKGYELHKYSDGISVNGEGRYPNILAAEKRAAELATEAQNA